MKNLQSLSRIPNDLILWMVSYIPGPLGNHLRYKYWRNHLKYLGNRVTIDVGAYFQNPQHITLDDDCWIDRNVLILAGAPQLDRITYRMENPDFKLEIGEVYIGKCSHIAPNCVLSGIGGLYIGRNSGVASNSAIYSFSHHYRDLTDRNSTWQYSFTPRAHKDLQSMILGPVHIGDYCAVGLSGVILPGVSLQEGVWIGSGSVISRTYDAQQVISSSSSLASKSLKNLIIKEHP